MRAGPWLELPHRSTSPFASVLDASGETAVIYRTRFCGSFCADGVRLYLRKRPTAGWSSARFLSGSHDVTVSTTFPGAFGENELL